MKRSLLRLFALGLLASVLVLPLGSVADAHAAYKFSSPDDETTVAQAPTEIWAEYTEPPTDGSYMKVFDPCGEQSDNGDSRAETATNRVYITQSSTRSGTYRVDWFVDSAADAHPTRGTFTFTVSGGEPCPGAEEPVEEKKSRERKNDSSLDDPQSQPDSQDGGDDGSGGSAAATGAARARSESGRHRHHNLGLKKDTRRRKDSDDGRVVAADDTGPSGPAPEEPGLLSDIPIGGLVIALAMAAAIGAAGGFIYAGIMGYHRVSN